MTRTSRKSSKKATRTPSPEDDDKQRLEDYVIMHAKKRGTRASSSITARLPYTDEDSLTEPCSPQRDSAVKFVVPSIVRSKSFSNDCGPESVASSASSHGGPIHHHKEEPRPRGRGQLQLPGSRTQSLRISKAGKSPSSSRAPTRFSWNSANVEAAVTEASSGSLKDSKYRGSVTSLASDVGSGATTPIPGKSLTFDISARELMHRPSVHHAGSLEMKKTSGFKSYKRFWAVLDSNLLYLYGREKDMKPKQVLDMSDCQIIEVASITDAVSAMTTSGSSTASFRESLRKRSARSFELVFSSTGESRYFAATTKEEAEEWMKKLRQAKFMEQQDIAYELDFDEEEALQECNESEAALHQGNHKLMMTESACWSIALKGHHSPDASR